MGREDKTQKQKPARRGAMAQQQDGEEEENTKEWKAKADHLTRESAS